MKERSYITPGSVHAMERSVVNNSYTPTPTFRYRSIIPPYAVISDRVLGIDLGE
jgi:hypothetical protein